jgi:cytosine/adenosine deaminase-related metal-dependent hydrolase
MARTAPVRYKARWLATGFGEVVTNAVFTVQDAAVVEWRSGGTADVDLGDVAVTPGFVNAHCHLDLSSAADLKPTGGAFVDWLRQVVEHRRNTPLEAVVASAEKAVEALLDTGTTTVGDVVGEPRFPILESLAAFEYVRFCEVLGHRKTRWEPLWKAAVERLHEPRVLASGVSPHAPYSTHRQAYWKAQSLVGKHPICTHWYESREELELLRTGGGALAEFLHELGAWPPNRRGGAWSLDPWPDYLRIAAGWLLVHANYVTSADLADAFKCAMGQPLQIVYCPRTHAAFGHDAYPLELLLRTGCRVCLGTDSLASNPDLDVFQEAKFVAERFSCVSGEEILRMLTTHGEGALLGLSRDYPARCIRRSANFAAISSPSRQATKKPRDRIDLRDLFDPTARVVWVMRKGVPRWVASAARATMPAATPTGH